MYNSLKTTCNVFSLFVTCLFKLITNDKILNEYKTMLQEHLRTYHEQQSATQIKYAHYDN